ncbi:MAG: FAD-dependent oxidoreductase [Clostridia bacterium]|nr:FAD-dependent oxidoreductase [Clostridia bacterium]
MYDIIIIGGGPAGLTAGIYAGEANKKVLILDKTGYGGQMSNINNITNFSGYESINGFDLTLKMKNQAINSGAEFLAEEVVWCNLINDVKVVKTHKKEYRAKNVIIASGAFAKTLDLQNEKAFLGKGLSYCATCDGNFFKDKVVAVVGGGNSSMDDCIYLSGLAKKIYLIHRRDKFTATDKLLNKVQALMSEDDKIEQVLNSVVTNLYGNEKLEEITVLNKITGEEKKLQVDGLFVAIGRKPDTEIYAGQLQLDNGGFIVTNEKMETNINGVYAAGDVRTTPLKQIITACSDGAIAVNSILKKG